MKDIIYLTVSSAGVQSMRKSYVGAKKGEVIVKLNVEVAKEAFTPPVVEKFVMVNDWKEGIDVEDVGFDQQFITEEEVVIIRERRLQKMRQILEEQGYKVEKEELGE